MPVASFYNDCTVVVLPAMVNLGSAFAGRRCNIIRAMVSAGGITEKDLSVRLGMGQSFVHEAILRMEREGEVFSMISGRERRLFLTNKDRWRKGLESETDLGRKQPRDPLRVKSVIVCDRTPIGT